MKSREFILNSLIPVMFLLLISCGLMAQDWQSDFEKSKELASENDKVIVLVFQGSDWCAPCMKLEQEIWGTEEFINYSKQHYVMLKADFPRKKKNQVEDEQLKKNKDLAEKYNSQGYFPFVVVLDKTGIVLGETGYKKMTPYQYINHLNSFIK